MTEYRKEKKIFTTQSTMTFQFCENVFTVNFSMIEERRLLEYSWGGLGDKGGGNESCRPAAPSKSANNRYRRPHIH
jgi:hypothetical protein